MNINERVKEVRLSLGLSQAKFADKISISSSYIAGIELGNKKVNPRLIKLISTTYNVREQWLQTGEGEKFLDQSDMLLKALSTKFMLLTPAHQNFVLKQIDNLLEMQENNK